MKELIYPSTYHAMKAGPCRVKTIELVAKAREVVK